MTADTRSAFVASRQLGIGGSDAGSLLSNLIEVEYGCERNLWARLSGIPADNPERETEPMLLGNILEPFVARAYADETGREVQEAGLQRHADHPSLQVHADRIIVPSAAGDHRVTRGVLEIKAVGSEMMRKIHEEGLPIDYIIQLNHGMLCHDLAWGAFAVGTREDLLPLVAIAQAAEISEEPLQRLPRQPKIIHFEMERNVSICNAIEEHGPRLWATLGDEAQAPPRMEPEDPRCGRCVRKVWCQGAALMAGIDPEHNIEQRPDLTPLVDEYRDNMAMLDRSLAAVAETENKFKAALDRTTAVKVLADGAWKNVIYRARAGAKRVDGRAMALQYDVLRRAAIGAGLPGAGMVPPSSEYVRTSGPSRPLLLKALLPRKDKPVGELDDVFAPDFE